MSLYYVSPHYDDAIGSCGGKIYMDYLNKKKPIIITVFSDVAAPFSNYADELHKYWGIKNPFTERKEENKNACKVINALEMKLSFEDAIYRTNNNEHLYPYNGDIFKKISKHDENLYIKIVDKLLNIINKDDILYFPMGIGSHVDHVIINKVGEYLKNNGYNVIYYVDFSYEGTIPIKYKLKESLVLEPKIIEKKSLAMAQYKSQINMLFGDKNNIFNYYLLKMKGKEDYYE